MGTGLAARNRPSRWFPVMGARSGTLFARRHPRRCPRSENPRVANTDQGRPTKAQRKEQARIEREEIHRKQASRSRNRNIGIIVGVVVIAAVVGLVIVLGGNNNTDDAATPTSSAPVLPQPDTLAGIMKAQPWPNNTEQLPARLAEVNLPQLSDNARAVHHPIVERPRRGAPPPYPAVRLRRREISGRARQYRFVEPGCVPASHTR